MKKDLQHSFQCRITWFGPELIQQQFWMKQSKGKTHVRFLIKANCPEAQWLRPTRSRMIDTTNTNNTSICLSWSGTSLKVSSSPYCALSLCSWKTSQNVTFCNCLHEVISKCYLTLFSVKPLTVQYQTIKHLLKSNPRMGNNEILSAREDECCL